MNETNHSGFKKRAVALAVASCLSLAPLLAQAAGLGKLTVLSALGQPLRAELDIAANKDELAGMTARLAPQDSFKQAGVDFASVLLDLRFTVEKRASGQSVVKVTSSKPINEPFLDFLVELNWPAGRLVREYTFLLDPPEVAAKQEGRPAVDARVVETVRGGGVAEERPLAAKSAARPAPAKVAAAEPAKPAAKKAETAGTHVVERGETLRKIAAENQYDGVSLEQMLVGLFRNNPDAFVGQNINRLKAGAILSVPDQASVAEIPQAEARKVYVTQAADWNAYRQKLAAATGGAPAKSEAAAEQTSGGKITAKVEEKAAPAEQAKDRVKVARTDAAGKGAADATAAAAADQIAKEKALKEAQDRMAALEKNVNELQKLLEMKNQKLAELQQPAKKEEAKPVEAAKPAEPPKPVEPPKPPEPQPVAKVEEAPKPVETPKPAEVKPAEPPKPEKPKVVVPPPVEPEPEPSFVDTLLEDPLPLAGGAAVLALLGGYLVARRRRGDNAAVETTAVPMPSSLGPNSVFRMTGGQSIDTGNTPPQTGDFSQTGPGTIDTDEVDPVAEADVYMAYGRDTQAEEILLEALQKDPQRIAIHAKLLEIYASRRSTKQFETLASELYAQTGGIGPEWEKVAALGTGLDPNNPLYSASRHTDPGAPGADIADSASQLTLDMSAEAHHAEIVSAPAPEPEAAPQEAPLTDSFIRNTVVLPQEPRAEAAPAPVPAAEVGLDSGADLMSLDFDLGAPEEIAPPVEPELPVIEAAEAPAANALDFDLDNQPADIPAAPVVMPDEPSIGLDFDLNAEDATLVAADAAAALPHDFSPEGTMVMPSMSDSSELDVGLGTWVGGEGGPTEHQEAPSPAELDASLSRTVVDQVSGLDTFVGASDLLKFGEPEANPSLEQTSLNTGMVDTDSLEFDVKLTDSMFLGQPMQTPEFDIGSINLDLSAAPAEPSPLADVAAPPVGAPVHDAQWEDANTKLDLAKAYEEMGDLEGARELLQEVVGEGPADLVEQARTILGRIGG